MKPFKLVTLHMTTAGLAIFISRYDGTWGANSYASNRYVLLTSKSRRRINLLLVDKTPVSIYIGSTQQTIMFEF